MKRFVALIITACLVLGLAACEKPHVHTFSDEWSYDDAYHFRKATCGDTDEVADREEHTIEDGKCVKCGFTPKVEEPKKLDNTVFLQETQAANDEQKARARDLISSFVSSCHSDGFGDGDLFCKDHTAEGSSAQNSEYRIDGFNGGFNDLSDIKVSFTRIVPSYNGTKREFYYADPSCAVEDLGAERNYYEAEGTAPDLLENLISDLETQINYAYTLASLPSCEIGYLDGDYEIVKLNYASGANDKSTYILVFSGGAAVGLKVNRSYFTSVAYVKQVELLIGDYGVEKPDTTGFKTLSYRPRWAAGFPTMEVFDREFTETNHSEIRSLLAGTANNLGRKDNTVILADGDIYFSYVSAATKNEITFDKDGLSMRVQEKSLIFESDAINPTASTILPSVMPIDGSLKPVPKLPEEKEDPLVEIEHFADAGICYETVFGETKAFIGDYSNMFYAMMPRTLVNMCDYINQYLSAPNGVLPSGEKAFETFINKSEFTSIKIVVPDCGQMFYVYDADGKIVAMKVEINGCVGTLLIGKYNVKIPTFDKYTASSGVPNTEYLSGVSNTGGFEPSDVGELGGDELGDNSGIGDFDDELDGNFNSGIGGFDDELDGFDDELDDKNGIGGEDL